MNRPYVVINCAMSADGKIALPSRKQVRISCEADMKRVHQLRNSCDAILVGIGTVLSDDPKLTVKEKYLDGASAKKPLRIVLDSNCRIPNGALVLNGDAPTIVFCADGKKRAIDGPEVVECGDGKVDLAKMLGGLAKRGVKRLMVEGGENVIGSFLRSGLFDEFSIYVGSMIIGGEGPTPAGGEGAKSEQDIIKLKLESCERLGDGILLKYSPGKRI
ncbi:MAG: 2,5-diamino-6-(ribosylamino)-4(3H)-pyrimidinone 5'-phosphate reductase [Candidatus Thermoplasmatota archaeon]|nr:2,5-diamino-6-(ribosylamino)-4(3H)-pyrimidinone 5'-phosphate reductase [Candidatus Thermoplasmatota archaeon]